MNISELQNKIKAYDNNTENKNGYFLKLVEEIGELSEAIRKQHTFQAISDNFKGSIDEELADVLYYVCAIANIYGIDLEQSVNIKDAINQKRYNQ